MHTACWDWLHCKCRAPCSFLLTFKPFKGICHGTRFCFALLYTPWTNVYWGTHQITWEMWGWSRDWTNKLPVVTSYDIMNISSTIFKILSDKIESTQRDAVIRKGKIWLWWNTNMRNHKVRKFGFRFSFGFQYHSSMSEQQDLPLTSARHKLGLAFLGRTLLLTWNNCDYSNKTAMGYVHTGQGWPAPSLQGASGNFPSEVPAERTATYLT